MDVAKRLQRIRGLPVDELSEPLEEVRLWATLQAVVERLVLEKVGGDLYTKAAAEVWGITEAEVTSPQRMLAKRAGFGAVFDVALRAKGSTSA